MITGLGFVPVAADFVFGFGFVFALVFIVIFVLVSGSTFQLAPAWLRRPRMSLDIHNVFPRSSLVNVLLPRDSDCRDFVQAQSRRFGTSAAGSR
jgi:hypothetical protein